VFVRFSINSSFDGYFNEQHIAAGNKLANSNSNFS